MLRTALGPEIAAWLEDASVIEVILAPRQPDRCRKKHDDREHLPDHYADGDLAPIRECGKNAGTHDSRDNAGRGSHQQQA